MELSIYEIVLIFSYFLTAIISLFYKYKLSDFSNPINPKNKELITFILLFLVYIPFIVSILHIFYRDLGVQYTNYIIFNSFLVLLLTPIIIYKDKILSYKLTSDYSIDELIDTRSIDSTGNLIDLNIDAIKKDVEEQKEIDDLNEKKNKLKEDKDEFDENKLTYVGYTIIIFFIIILLGLIIRKIYEKIGKTDNFFFKDIKIKLGILLVIFIFIIIMIYVIPYSLYSDSYINEKIDEIQGDSKDPKDKQRRSNSSIRLKAAVSEYFNRRDMDEGIYD